MGRRISLVIELRVDSKTTFDEAIGQSTYSHDRAGVLAYVAIFENLCAQTELYGQVRQASEQLEFAKEQLRDRKKIQKEFSNISVYELLIQVQPILCLSAQVLRSKRIESSLRSSVLRLILSA